MSGHKTTAKRGVADDCDAELAARLHQSNVRVFDVYGKWGVFDLHGVDVMDFTGAAERLARDFAKTEVLNLALAREELAATIFHRVGGNTNFFNSTIASTVFSIGVSWSTR